MESVEVFDVSYCICYVLVGVEGLRSIRAAFIACLPRYSRGLEDYREHGCRHVYKGIQEIPLADF